jgi:hypothetical protein
MYCLLFRNNKRVNRGPVDRERIPAGRRNYNWTPSLPEKAKGFTKRSYPKGHAHLLCYAANLTAQRISIRVTFRLYASQFGFLRALHLSIFEQSIIMGL